MPAIDPDEYSSNPSTDPHFRDVAAAHPRRRTVLLGGAAAAAAALFAVEPAAARGGGRPLPVLGFPAVQRSTDDAIRVPAGYTATPFIPWGTPILAPYPEFVPALNTADDQAAQTGMHHDGMHFFPLRGSSSHGLLVLNHEYADELHLQFGTATGVLPDPSTWTLEMVRKSQAAHGVSVVEIRSSGRRWEVVRGRYNRRVTASTPMEFTGPARGHRLVRTAADAAGTAPIGTFNNCAHGYTPWGTYLTCEENFNNYFRVEGAGFDAEATALLARYTVAAADSQRWATSDARFRVRAAAPNEPNRYGWVVEIDPFDPTSTPRKRTALGRLKHEGATTVVSRSGHVVVYMGDDQVDEYVYKFVGKERWRAAVAAGRSPLDEGTLYVARFDADGTGVWLPLVAGEGPLTAAAGFADAGDVLVKARLAATLLGATPMDRPEWVAVDPRTTRVYLTCTNNTNVGKIPNAANPRKPNPLGHIVCWEERRRDHTETRFDWNLVALAGAGADSGDGSTVLAEDAFGSPDGLWADPDGRLWIQTDASSTVQPGGGNNQMLVADLTGPRRDGAPAIRRFLTGPRGCEITGATTTPDLQTMFVNVQHPGEEGNITPARASTWPNLGPTALPRSATVIVTRDGGGVVGT